MSSPKQPQSDDKSPFESDLKRNPEIGQSGGGFETGDDIALIEGENTVIGDVENDSTPAGGVNPNQLGRTNK